MLQLALWLESWLLAYKVVPDFLLFWTSGNDRHASVTRETTANHYRNWVLSAAPLGVGRGKCWKLACQAPRQQQSRRRTQCGKK